MPLIKCSDCGQDVSETASACVGCGRPVWAPSMAPSHDSSGSVDHVSSYADLPFHPMSPTKLAILSVTTFSLYQFVWFYRNWKKMKERGAKLMPIMRTIFAPLFSYELFKAVRDEAGLRRVNHAWRPGGMAIGYFILTAFWQLPDLLWLWGLFTFTPLMSLQKTINEVLDVDGERHMDSSYGPGTVILIVAGGLCLSLVLIASFLPE